MTHKTFIATLTAAALAIATLSAAPARADSDAAKIIAGVAVLAIIGAAIADAHDDDSYVVNRNYYRYGHQPRRVHRNKHHRHGHYRHYHRHGHRHHRHH